MLHQMPIGAKTLKFTSRFCFSQVGVVRVFNKCLSNPTESYTYPKASVILDKTEVVDLEILIKTRPVAPRDHFSNDGL